MPPRCAFGRVMGSQTSQSGGSDGSVVLVPSSNGGLGGHSVSFSVDVEPRLICQSCPLGRRCRDTKRPCRHQSVLACAVGVVYGSSDFFLSSGVAGAEMLSRCADGGGELWSFALRSFLTFEGCLSRSVITTARTRFVAEGFSSGSSEVLAPLILSVLRVDAPAPKLLEGADGPKALAFLSSGSDQAKDAFSRLLCVRYSVDALVDVWDVVVSGCCSEVERDCVRYAFFRGRATEDYDDVPGHWWDLFCFVCQSKGASSAVRMYQLAICFVVVGMYSRSLSWVYFEGSRVVAAIERAYLAWSCFNRSKTLTQRVCPAQKSRQLLSARHEFHMACLEFGTGLYGAVGRSSKLGPKFGGDASSVVFDIVFPGGRPAFDRC